MELKEYELGELLPYIQPSAYIVNSTKYSDSYKTPVLTAGKSFILGYTDEEDNIFEDLPVIIFDDFTTATQYVNFKFKVKSSAMKILKINTELVYPKYIFYRMQTIQVDHSTHKRYWIQQYSKIKIAIPPLEEQERIVAKIEEMFSDLDNAVETLNETKQKLDVYRQAVLKDAFNGFENWDKYKFGNLMQTVRNGYGKKPTDSGKHKILKISAVRSLNLNLDECRYNDFAFETQDIISENDLLFTRYNGNKDFVGVCAVVPKLTEPYAYPDKLIKCTPKLNEVVHSKFLSYYLSQGNARKYLRSKIKTTSGQNGIAGSDIKNTIVYLPDLDVQEQVVFNIETKLSAYEGIENTVNLVLEQVSALRQSILKQAFEGRLI